MRNKAQSQVNQLSPAERLVDREANLRATALGIGVELVSYRQVAVKLAVKVLLLQSKLRIAEESIRDAEDSVESFVGSKWLTSTLEPEEEMKKKQRRRRW